MSKVLLFIVFSLLWVAELYAQPSFGIYGSLGTSNTNDYWLNPNRENEARFSWELGAFTDFHIKRWLHLEVGLGVSEFNHFTEYPPIALDPFYQENQFDRKLNYADLRFSPKVCYKKWHLAPSILGSHLLRGVAYEDMYVELLSTGEVVTNIKDRKSQLTTYPKWLLFYRIEIGYQLLERLEIFSAYRRTNTNPFPDPLLRRRDTALWNYQIGLKYGFK